MEAEELVEQIKEYGIKLILAVTGISKSVDMPLRGMEGALEDGVWFDGSSMEGFARIQESDMHFLLDPNTDAVLL